MQKRERMDDAWRRMLVSDVAELRGHGVRQSHIAKALKWTESGLSKYLNGSSSPPISRVADVYQLMDGVVSRPSEVADRILAMSESPDIELAESDDRLDSNWRQALNDVCAELAKHGVHQADIARAMDWSPAALLRYLRGDSDPSANRVADFVELTDGMGDGYGNAKSVAVRILDKSKQKKYDRSSR